MVGSTVLLARFYLTDRVHRVMGGVGREKEGTRCVNVTFSVCSVSDLDSFVFLLSKLCDDPQVCVGFVTSLLLCVFTITLPLFWSRNAGAILQK